MNIIFLGGFSNSGKSSVMKIFKEEFGYNTYSTSALLHQAYEKFHEYDHSDTTLPEVRAEHIRIAEEVLRPVFGQEIFADAIYRQVMQNSKAILGSTNVIETIGGKEFTTLMERFEDSPFHTQRINIRRKEERPGIDIRELLPDAIDFWNEGDLADLKRRLKRYF
jgi:hypothetical protein